MPPTLPPQPSVPSYVGPAFDDAKVGDVMRVGVVGCRAQTGLTDVARMMTGYGTHSIVVWDVEGGGVRPWGIVTSLDLARVADRADSLTAGEVASSELLTVESNAPLKAAARLMAEHGVSHLVVVQPDTGQPAGVLSARAIAAALAWG